MWAVVEIKAKQYIVRKDDEFKVELLDQKEGSVTFDKVLLTADGENVKVGAPYLTGAKVTATVLGEKKSARVYTGRFKRRKKYRRLKGHRQDHTVIKITEIAA